VRIVVAPDKFKESLAAVDVARAIAVGVRRVLPDAELELYPLADGGDGTGRALLEGLGGRTERLQVTGPVGTPVAAEIVLLHDGRAVVEMASASGVALVEARKRDPLAATSFGTGELISAAVARGATDVLVAVGGSASTDGGVGAASAVGWRFLDERGGDLPLGGGALASLARIDPDGVAPSVRAATILGACDVDNPLVGKTGAAVVFGPQKGAGAPEIAVLEEGLERLASVIGSDLGIEVASAPRAGAGGGMGAGLMAFFGARLDSGFDVIAGSIGLEEAVRRADLVITGEGRLDESSLGGKTPVAVAALAAGHGVPCVAAVGRVALGTERLESIGMARVVSLVDEVGEEQALEDPAASIAAAIERLLGEFIRSHP
jgi:glycerate 2-kinase